MNERIPRALFVALWMCFCARSSAAATEFDVAIQGGQIFDGTGGPSYPGDIGIRGDRI